MKWIGRRGSTNIEDRRGMRPRAGLAFGGGVGGLVIILLVVLMGGDPSQLLDQTNTVSLDQPWGQHVPSPEEEETAKMVAVVLADTEEVWRALFQEIGHVYQEPTLVLFSERVQSACGMAGAAVGPFYCPNDRKAYIDLSFYDELSRRFGAPGDFAQAYVLAHEVGHHVQNLLGLMERMEAERQNVSESEYNQLSVRLELQADFLAGVWAHHAEGRWQILEPGDIEEALRAASAIGDDRLQQQSQGYVVPDAFTHGTSEQRVRWFRRGFETGDVSQGDTFSAPDL